MPKILLIDCYPAGWENRLAAYLGLLSRFGEVLTVKPSEIASAPDGYRAAVLTGSPLMLSEAPPPAELTDTLPGLTVPVLGICFGHQFLGVATGLSVARREFYEGPGLIRVRQPDPLFSGLDPEPVVFESHAEYLAAGPAVRAGWEILADSRLCPVEAMRHRRHPWYGVQFHPERSGAVGVKVLANFFDRVVA